MQCIDHVIVEGTPTAVTARLSCYTSSDHAAPQIYPLRLNTVVCIVLDKLILMAIGLLYSLSHLPASKA